ncbi:major facilitator superfamily MFS_1 [Ruminiclostridium papyrosolvens DSM 2782]|uniref:Major facilitator superfamily MFS_1 n=1 Tax=Ruminiclostridium papyrosolvens DSM 2782 TaxID=588581 RepID=F1TEQ7_9FIRM|nr:MFS transporter [Ruminiclostridium papyrosolvens]EGD47223.1 major facilitator superfamily MFS_1 [Ruminiclostridium papyrosolvens DSM 2782]WES36262.1 MFS transporter [Ruminiclostridium papyrosolvens DSM 2782]
MSTQNKLWSRNFSLLVGGQLFSVFANAILQFTLSLYVLDLTGSAGVFAGIMALSVIPRVVFLPFGGILADRLPKKKVMIALDSCYTILTVVLGLGLLYRESVLLIAVISIMLGVASAFETPVVQSAIPAVQPKEHLEQSNGIVSAVAMLANLLAPALAGLLYSVLAVPVLFMSCCVVFAVAVVLESFLIIPYQKSVDDKKAVEIVAYDVSELNRYLKTEQPVIVRISIVAALINMLISSFLVVGIPYIARVSLSVSSELFGTMQTLFAVGGLLGSISVGVITKVLAPDKLHRLLLVGAVLFSCLTIPFLAPMTDNAAFWVITVVSTVMQGVFAALSVYLISLIQKLTKPDMLGRVMSMVLMLSTVALPIGQGIYGALMETRMNRIAFVILAVGILCGGIALLARKDFGRLNLQLEKVKQYEEEHI